MRGQKIHYHQMSQIRQIYYSTYNCITFFFINKLTETTKVSKALPVLHTRYVDQSQVTNGEIATQEFLET